MQELLEMLIKFSNTNVKIRKDPKLIPLSDERVLLGNPSKLKDFASHPQIRFEITLTNIFSNLIVSLS